jgi:MioC protein
VSRPADQVVILFGTESGNAELVADDIGEELTTRGIANTVWPMEDYDVAELANEEFAVVITSTYGDGELPRTTLPFYESLTATEPNLQNLRFAAFGLGDSVYDTFNNAIGIVAAKLTELGATQIGAVGEHDAAGLDDFSDAATAWIDGILETANRA